MSLIYSALNRLEQEPGAQETVGKTVARHSGMAAAQKSDVPRWVYLAVFGCILLMLAGWLAANIVRDRFAASTLRAPDQLASPSVAPAFVAGFSVPATAADAPAMPVQSPPPASPASFPSTGSVAAAEPIVRAAAASGTQEPDARNPMMLAAPPVEAKIKSAKAAQSTSRAQPVAKPEAAVPDEINPDEANSLTLAIKRAVQSGKNDEAEALLKQLGARLEPESITLLRLRAWHKSQSGDQAQAIALYRQIVGRIPDDEAAVINLALLVWKSGQQDEARRLIGALSERHPESETVQRYSAQFGALK